MGRYSYFIKSAFIFVILSAFTYFIHFLIFRDPHHIFIYLVGDLGFLPLEVFLVVIIIERILSRREKQIMLQKLNMVVGAFFSEVGSPLLGDLLRYFDNRAEISSHLNVTKDWKPVDFKRADAYAYSLQIDLDCRKVDLEGLKAFLSQKRTFMLGLMENPNLLEHDRFTDLLWAVTHLDEELQARPSLKDLPEQDLHHLAVDIQRMYDHLSSEWLDYVQHLRSNYPFLYSLVLRIHPFQEHPSAIIV